MEGFMGVMILNHKQRRELRRKSNVSEHISFHQKNTTAVEPYLAEEVHKLSKFPKGTDRHHKRPRSKGGDSSDSNIIEVPIAKHRAYHVLYQNNLPPEIAEELNRNWIDRCGWLMIAVQVELIERGRNICKIYRLQTSP
jgi:hypothetical protein